jgi:hypothetical protein
VMVDLPVPLRPSTATAIGDLIAASSTMRCTASFASGKSIAPPFVAQPISARPNSAAVASDSPRCRMDPDVGALTFARARMIVVQVKPRRQFDVACRRPSGGTVTDTEFLLECEDLDGRRTLLAARLWYKKILRDHPEMGHNQYAVQRTLQTPDCITRDRIDDHREVFYKRNVLPEPFHRHYCKVVVEIERTFPFRQHATVITAYPVDRIAEGESQRWPKKRRIR